MMYYCMRNSIKWGRFCGVSRYIGRYSPLIRTELYREKRMEKKIVGIEIMTYGLSTVLLCIYDPAEYFSIRVDEYAVTLLVGFLFCNKA